MQGHIALLAAEERLVVLLALVGALLAVPPLGGALAVELSQQDPVIEAVVSGLTGGAAAHPLPDGQHPIPPEQFQGQLPQEGLSEPGTSFPALKEIFVGDGYAPHPL